jgi:hypothetical protein
VVVQGRGIFRPASAGRVVPEADDRELRPGREGLEVIGSGDPPGQVLRQLDVRLDEPREAGGPEVLPREPQLEGPPPPGALEAEAP